MFNSQKKKLLAIITIALVFGIFIGVSACASFSCCILILIGYTWGFIVGAIADYFSRNEKVNAWVASKLFWRRKNV